jgi:hypothetical protein
MSTRHLRLALALALAALLALAPAAMAISGSSAKGQASAAQYSGPGQNPTTPPGDEGTEPSTDEEQPVDTGRGGGEPDGDVAPAAGGDDATPTASAPLTEASAPEAGSLPFTGYVAMTVLLLGAASLMAGLVLRRRTGAAA